MALPKTGAGSFPIEEIREGEWVVEHREEWPIDDRDSFPHRFEQLRRVSGS